MAESLDKSLDLDLRMEIEKVFVSTMADQKQMRGECFLPALLSRSV